MNTMKKKMSKIRKHGKTGKVRSNGINGKNKTEKKMKKTKIHRNKPKRTWFRTLLLAALLF